MRTPWLRLLLVGGLGVIASGGYLAVASVSGPRPPDYRAAVMRLLDQQGLPYHDVIITDGCAPTYQWCRTYAGTVRVLAEVEHTGQIACAERWTACTVSIPDLNIVAAPLQDTRDPRLWRWQQLWVQAVQWLRGLW